MARTSPKTQAEAILTLITTLLAEPRLSASQIASAMGRSEAWINSMTMQFRDAGFDIEYDKANRRYTGDLTDKFAKTLLGPYATKLRKAIGTSEISETVSQSLQSGERHTIRTFSQMLGTSYSNVMNMIIGYKGQKLPSGWLAFQNSSSGKWYIQKMTPDATGKRFRVPKDVENIAFRIVKGEGDPVDTGRRAAIERSQCTMCGGIVLAKGLCSTHYYQERRRHKNRKRR